MALVYDGAIQRLIDAIAELPGIGPKGAQRGNVCESSPCPICADPRRDRGVICVVEEVKDVMSIERTHTFRFLSPLLRPSGINVTRLASGLPVVGDLEYADEITLGRALEGRREA